jgi:hypothetical protein
MCRCRPTCSFSLVVGPREVAGTRAIAGPRAGACAGAGLSGGSGARPCAYKCRLTHERCTLLSKDWWQVCVPYAKRPRQRECARNSRTAIWNVLFELLRTYQCKACIINKLLTHQNSWAARSRGALAHAGRPLTWRTCRPWEPRSCLRQSTSPSACPALERERPASFRPRLSGEIGLRRFGSTNPTQIGQGLLTLATLLRCHIPVERWQNAAKPLARCDGAICLSSRVKTRGK